MKHVLVVLLIAALILPGCATIKENPKTAIGAGVGAVVGAGVGAAVGGGKGAAIGAVVGGLAGGLIGHYMDKQKREFEQATGRVTGTGAGSNHAGGAEGKGCHYPHLQIRRDV